MLLLVTAALKLRPLLSDLFRFGLFELSDSVTVALVVAEVGAALLLLSSPHRRQSWLIAALMFLGFFVAATGAAFRGQRSCGCLGEFSVFPWVMAALDAVFVVLTSIALGSLRRAISSTRQALQIWHCCAIATLTPIIAGLLFVALSKLQSTGHLAGPALVAVEHDVPVISRSPQTNFAVVSVRFCNSISRPVRVAGTKLGCDTRVLSQLPLTLAPGASASLDVVTRIPADAPRATLEILLYTSGTPRLEQPLKFSVAGR